MLSSIARDRKTAWGWVETKKKKDGKFQRKRPLATPLYLQSCNLLALCCTFTIVIFGESYCAKVAVLTLEDLQTIGIVSAY